MKLVRWQILLGLALILLSAILYSIHYAIFNDAHHIYIYLLGDIAFLPVEVLLVTIIIHQLLTQREKKAILEKLNMVIGSFFSEVGTRLLTYFSDFDPKLGTIKDHLIVKDDWSEPEFAKVSKYLRDYDYNVDIKKVDLEGLRTFLMGKREFLLLLLENPALLEHETFSELLRAVFHLTEELEKREQVKQLPEKDYAHLARRYKESLHLAGTAVVELCEISQGQLPLPLLPGYEDKSLRPDRLAVREVSLRVVGASVSGVPLFLGLSRGRFSYPSLAAQPG